MPHLLKAFWNTSPAGNTKDEINHAMEQIETFHERSQEKLKESFPAYTYCEKSRKKICQNFLYITGANICKNILGYSLSEWAEWFEKSVVYVSFIFGFLFFLLSNCFFVANK